MDDAARRVERLEALNELTAALARAETVDQICARALGGVRRALAADRASVLLFDDEGTLRFRAWHGLSERYRQATEGHSPWTSDVTGAQPIVVADVDADRSLGDLREVVLAEGIRALAFVPIEAEGSLLGKYMLYFDAPRSLDRDELEAALAAGGHIGIAVARRRAERSLRESRDQLEAILRAVSDAVTVQDARGRLVYANDAAARLLGAPDSRTLVETDPRELVADYELLDEAGRPFDPAALPGRVALAGGTAGEATVRWRSRTTGAERWSSVRAYPVHDETGAVVFAVNVIRDVTEERHRTLWADFAAEAATLLAESLDHDETLRRAAELSVPRLADWCAIHVGDEQAVRPVVVAHRDPERVRWALEMQERYPPEPAAPGGVPNVIRTGRPELHAEISDELLAAAAARDEQHLALLRSLGLASAMVVPLSARGSTFGAITFVSTDVARRYSEVDLRLAGELARLVALAADNARLHRAERDARREAEQTAALNARLQTVTARLASAVFRDEVVEAVVSEGLGALAADAGAVFVLGEGRRALELLGQVGYPDELVPRHTRVPLDGRGPAAEAMATGELVVVETAEELVERWPDVAEAQRRTGDAATIAAPLLREGRPFGVLYVAFRAPRRVDERQRELVRTLASLLAQALERTRLYEEEHGLALAFQETLLPASLPRAERVELAARYRPGGTGLQVGGDWYDVIDLEGGRVGIVVGDVVGHGLRAALTMGQLRNAVRAYALEEQSPARVLEQLNQFALSIGEDAFGTVVYAVVDQFTGSMRVASAGHPPLVLVPPAREAHLLEGRQSLPVGSLGAAVFAETETTLEPGTTVVAYTDGLVERRTSPLDAGLERIRHAASAPADSADALAELILDDLLGHEQPDDDVALVVFRLLPARTRLVRDLPLDPAALAPLRRDLAGWLRTLGATDSEVYDITLCCMEACTNAIEHAVTPSRPLVNVTAEVRGDDVVLVVRDHGGWLDRPRRLDRGRGLLFMQTFMDAVEVRRSATGSDVVLRRRLGTRA